MNTTVQNTTTKTSSPRRSRFPGKETGSVSFNLTALGRQLLRDQAAALGVSNGDYVEMLIRERSEAAPLKLSSSSKQTGPKGGAKSYFFGKNRGTTTAVCVTPIAHRLLDEQVGSSRMSRGDYVEYLLREKAGMIDAHLRAIAMAAGQPPGALDTVPQPQTTAGEPQPAAENFVPATTTNPSGHTVPTDWSAG